MKLLDLKKNEVAVVVKIENCSPPVARRLGDLGIQPGQKIVCLQTSPFGGVTSYQLSHGVFALEDVLAEKVLIEKVDSQ